MIINHYKLQHYSTFFNPNTGFFARVEEQGYEEPFWSFSGPELMDISITNWCDKGCSFCYRKSDESGTNMSLENYEVIMSQAKQMKVLQVALGGGNPNQHPEFCEILRVTREKYGIVPNYTTNGRGLTQEVLEATKKYCGAVAVSAYYPYSETSNAIDLLEHHGVKTNIHFILSSQSIDTAIGWLNAPPSFLSKINALIFLNYKPIGRYSSQKLLLKNSSRVEEFFSIATGVKHGFRIGFDTCTITGVARYSDTSPIAIEGCDAGRFSMFVSEDMKAYPCSFMVEAEGYEGTPIEDKPLVEIWKQHQSFRKFREAHQKGGCSSCQTPDLCLSGCPLFPEINLCSQPIVRLSDIDIRQ
jgi:radical SAM protein with 4Fe4S-binding SPASM domain